MRECSCRFQLPRVSSALNIRAESLNIEATSSTKRRWEIQRQFLCLAIPPSHEDGIASRSTEKACPIRRQKDFRGTQLSGVMRFPMTPTRRRGGFSTRARKRHDCDGGDPREIRKWLKLNEHSRRAREEDRMSSARLIKLPTPFGLSVTRHGAASREIRDQWARYGRRFIVTAVGTSEINPPFGQLLERKEIPRTYCDVSFSGCVFRFPF